MSGDDNFTAPDERDQHRERNVSPLEHPHTATEAGAISTRGDDEALAEPSASRVMTEDAPAATGATAEQDASTFESLAPGPDTATLAERQRRWGWWYATEASLGALKSYGWIMLLQGFGSPLIYVMAFGVGLAALMQSRGQQVDGVDYLTFVASGLVLSGAFMTAFLEGSFPVFGGFKWRGSFFVGANAGLTPAQQAIGIANFALIRTLPAVVFFLVILAIAGGLPSWGAVWMIPISVLVALSVCLPAMAFAAWLRDDRGQWNMLNRFVVMPLMLFSGTYYPLEVLPVGMQWIGWISPLWHGIDLGRVAIYGLDRPVWLIVVHVLVLLATIAVGWMLAHHHFKKRLDQ